MNLWHPNLNESFVNLGSVLQSRSSIQLKFKASPAAKNKPPQLNKSTNLETRRESEPAFGARSWSWGRYWYWLIVIRSLLRRNVGLKLFLCLNWIKTRSDWSSTFIGSDYSAFLSPDKRKSSFLTGLIPSHRLDQYTVTQLLHSET